MVVRWILILCLPVTMAIPDVAANASAQEVSEPKKSAIFGTVVDDSTTGPLCQAQVYMVASGFGALTDATGYYVIQGVPSGTYEMVVERIDYATIELPGLELPPDTLLELNFSLQPRNLPVDFPQIHVECDDVEAPSGTTVEATALWWASPERPSFHCVPSAVQRRIVGDSAIMQAFVGLLEGRIEAIGWDTATVLRWVAIARRPEDAPLLLRFAPPDSPLAYSRIALEGLTRQAALVEEAKRRLITIASASPVPYYREWALRALIAVNDLSAREFLEQLPEATIPEFIQRHVSFVLSGRPCRPGELWGWHQHLPCRLRRVPETQPRCQEPPPW